MRKLYPLLLGSGLWLVAPAVRAQQAPATVTGDFRGLRFEQFVQRLEAQTPYRFYFNPATTDTITVRVQATGQPLVAVLTQVLQPTGLSFALDEAGRRVFITTGHPLQVQLPDSYFQPGSALGPPPAIPDDAAVANQPALAGTSEFKLYEIGTRQAATAGKATLSGVVRLAGTGQPAVGVAVYVEKPSVGVATDRAGRYVLALPPGRYNVNIRGIGVRSSRRQVWLRGSGQLDLEVAPDAAVLKEVVVEGQRDRNVRSLQMGVQTLDIKTIKQVPTVFGEADILRVVMALPGVKTVGEGSTGMSVRGGGTDQNLVLYNDAVIYNPAHLFGFFSAFNPDVIKSVDLYKSAIPVRYGGRLSSVLDIRGREGGRKKFGGSGGIGPLTSRLELEGPLGSTGDGAAKGSYIVGGRASYSDWLLHLVPNSSLKNSAASFYDLNGSVTYDFNARNSLYASGYYSRDRFRLASDTVYNYHNTAASLKWRHDFTSKLQAYFIGAYSNYDFGLSTTRNVAAASTFDYFIKQVSGQAHFNYLAGAKHTLDFGGSSILYNTQPGNLQPLGEQSLLLPVTIQHERAVESALYASERFDISPRFSVQAGLRYSFFQALGPRTVTNYQEGISRSESTATGTNTYGAGQVLAHYEGPEWRLSTRLELTAHSSVKASLTRMRQYIHQLTNTTVVSPTDSWKLSDSYIRPQVGDQVSLGYYHNFKRNTVEFSLEGYYKRTHDFLDYKSGAILLLNPHLETDLVNAEGRAYGVEALLRKTEGKLNGWLSYTYARSLVQVSTPTDVVNGGAWYPSNYDKPHDVTLVGNYRFSRRFNLSLNFNYSTGRPITLPLAKYYVDQALRVYFSDRNAYRVPDYYRVDLAVNFEGNHKIEKLAHSSWTVAVYNLLGRRNPYSVYFQTINGQIRGYKLSIFGEPIPTVTYNFRF